jgi:hypothetical protein
VSKKLSATKAVKRTNCRAAKISTILNQKKTKKEESNETIMFSTTTDIQKRKGCEFQPLLYCWLYETDLGHHWLANLLPHLLQPSLCQLSASLVCEHTIQRKQDASERYAPT